MTETTDSSPIASAAPSPIIKTKKKVTIKVATTAKKPVAAHPPTSVMVTAAIKELKERKGSSLAAIKKYLAANYKVDPVKVAPFIRKFLTASVTNGTILQIKGSYKLAATAEAKPPKKEAVAKKPVVKKVKAAVTSTPIKKKPTTKKSKTVSGEPAVKKAKKTPLKASKATPPVTVKPKKKAGSVKKPAAAKPKQTPKKL